MKIHRYIIIFYIEFDCGLLTKFSLILENSKVQRYAIIWFLVFNNCELLIQVLLLFQRNFSVGSVFMAQPIFQFLQEDHIWMLLLLQRIFPEVQELMLIHIIVYNLYGCLSCFRGLFQQVHDSLWFSLGWSTIRNRRSSVTYQTF